MKIKYKILFAFLFVSFLVSLVGLIGLYANRNVVASYNEGKEHFGTIMEASNELTSYAKRAQGHTFLFLTLNNRSDRKKVSDRIASLREQIAIMDKNIKDPEAMAILNSSRARTDEMQSVIEELFKAHDTEMEMNGTFDFKRHESLIRKLDDISSDLRRNGLELGKIEMKLQQVHDSSAEENAANIYKIIFLINVISLASVILVWFVIDRNISNPLNKLKTGAIRIRKGNFDEKINIKSDDEIGDLSNEFNRMSQDLKKSNEEISSSKKYTENIILSMNEALIITSTDCMIHNVNAAACKMSNYSEDELIGQHISKIIPRTDHTPMDSDSCCSIKKNSNIETEILSKNSLKIPVILSNSIMSIDEKVAGLIYIAHDITERKKDEAQIRNSLQEKEVLLKEIHHRVKNNMQIISSLLDHQMGNITDEKVKDMLSESKNRIYSMSLVHEKLYQSRDLRNIDFKDYINDLAINLFQNYNTNSGKIKLNSNIEGILLDIDLAIPTGLIITELMINSFKYAFPGDREGEIKILFRSLNDNMLELIVSDNGVGIPKGINFRKTTSLGLHLVTVLSESQLHGTIEMNRGKGTGTEFHIKFKRGGS